MLIGAIAAWLGRRDDVSSRRWALRGAVATSVFLASALAAYAKGPDWMWMYFLEPPALTVVDLAFMAVVLYYLPFAAGFALTRAGERRWPGRGGLLVAASALVLNVYVVARLFDRYAHVGTRADYLAGRAAPLAGDHALKGVLNAGGAALGATLVVLVALAVVEARRARVQP
jgi:hypothetical protein